MKKVDPTTWIDKENLAANRLADLLTEICDESLTKKVSVYFHRFNIRMKALNGMEKGHRSFFRARPSGKCEHRAAGSPMETDGRADSSRGHLALLRQLDL